MTSSFRPSLSLLRRTGVLAAACVLIGPVLAQDVDKHVPARAKALSKPPLTAVSVLPPWGSCRESSEVIQLHSELGTNELESISCQDKRE